mgnify:FL=1
MEEINLKELFDYFIDKIKYIIIATLVCCLIGGIYTKFLTIPMYKSSTTVILGSNQEGTGITQSDISINNNLVSTYAEIIKSRRVLEQVQKELNESYTYKELASEISVSSINNTQIIKITVEDNNALNAKIIANLVAKVFTVEVPELYNLDNVHILDVAIEEDEPYNINVAKSSIIGGLLGLVLSSGIFFVIYYFDRTAKSVEQVEEVLQMPILGSVEETKNLKEELVVATNPKEIISEQIRTIRTNLQFTSADEKIKTILITSSIPSEGKSFISSNLATAFAQNNKKVLIVDCDMRKGRVNKIFKISNRIGLSNLLAYKEDDEENLEDYVFKTKIDNLYVIPRGKVPPNPSELLNSQKTAKLISLLSEIFDYIIFDGPPVNGLSDSLIMSDFVDRTIVVTSLNSAPIELLESTKKMLTNVNAKVAGVIVNKVPRRKSSGKSYYYYENTEEEKQ